MVKHLTQLTIMHMNNVNLTKINGSDLAMQLTVSSV
jgi:hypothetical protein